MAVRQSFDLAISKAKQYKVYGRRNGKVEIKVHFLENTQEATYLRAAKPNCTCQKY